MHDSLRLMVSISRDGWLYQAAQRIMRQAPPLTGRHQEFHRLEIIRTWRFARGDRLSSN